MSDYPSSSPWGPHGPQVSPFSVTPNPTAPSPMPGFSQPDSGTSWAPAPGYSGGTSSAGSGAASAGAVAFRRVSIWPWIGKLAFGGLVLGALFGFVRAMMLHTPPAIIGMLTLRLGLAGAAAGAGIPPAIRAVGVALRAALWIAIAAACWMFAMAAAGQLGWLTRLR